MMIDSVREAAVKLLLFLPHAIRQMNKPERMITETEVREVVMQGEIIEDYPEDVRGHSCLMAGETTLGRTIPCRLLAKRRLSCHYHSLRA